MPKYFYTAVSFSGETISGEESAQHEKELSKILHDKGFVLTSARTKQKKTSALGRLLSISFGVSLTEKLMFVRNLKVMVGAGVPLPRALEILSQQTSSRSFAKVLADMKERVMKGNALSLAMEQHRSVFPDLFINMAKVGEESGTLEQVLSQLSLQLEKEHDLKSKIIGALMYPAVVVSAMAGVGFLMLIVVVPQLAKTFQDLNVELPLTTRFVIGLGNFLAESWYVALGLLAVGGIGARRFFKTQNGKALLDSFLLRVPVLSGIIKKTNSALTVRTLSSLIAAGVPIVRSLEITSKALGNARYQLVLARAAEAVSKGSKLSGIIEEYPELYPVIVGQMMEVGEETGTTSEVLAKLAEFFEDEVTQLTKNLASLVEPVLMLIIGAAVGFFAVSMLQPMYGLLNTLQTQ